MPPKQQNKLTGVSYCMYKGFNLPLHLIDFSSFHMADKKLELTKNLTPIMRAFAERYVVHLNAKKAAGEAGCTGKNLTQIGFQLFNTPKVQLYIQFLREQQMAAFGLTPQRVLQEAARLAFVDPGKMYDENGCLKPLHEMDEDTRRAISSVETEELFDTDPDNPRKKKYVGDKKRLKLFDKVKSVEMLMKHFGQFAEHNNQKCETTNINIEADQVAIIAKKLDDKY